MKRRILKGFAAISDFRDMGVQGAQDHLRVQSGNARLRNAIKGHRGKVQMVATAQEDEYPIYLFARLHPAAAQLQELWPQQCVSGAEQHATTVRYLADIAFLKVCVGVLVKQNITIVRPVGKVVDDHDAIRGPAQASLPAGVETVVVDDEPVPPRRVGQCRNGFVGLDGPVDAQPAGMGWIVGSGREVVRCECRQAGTFVTGLAYQHLQALRQLAADEAHLGVGSREPVGQRQAAHQVTAADDG